MRTRRTIVAATVLSATVAMAQAPDPRTAAGQLAACGGATAWQGIGYLEFSVRSEAPAGVDGPWTFHWDRRNNYVRVIGPTADGAGLDLTLDVGARTGGGSSNGKPLVGDALAQRVAGALGRFGEAMLWLTFPLEWGAAGVTVTPGPDATVGTDRFLTTRIASRAGSWVVWLDPGTGRIVRTQATGAAGSTTVWWSEWKPVGGVFFAGQRRVDETHSTVTIDVTRALATTPVDAF